MAMACARFEDARGPLGALCSSDASAGWRAAVVELCASCGGDSPEYICSSCRRIAYCCRECQRRHWAAHKTACLPSRGDAGLSGRPLASSAACPYLHTLWGFWDRVGLPRASREGRARAAQLLPTARLVLWGRTAVEQLLDEAWREVWDALPRAVSQADVARYLIAWKVGGIYLDADAELLKAPPAGSWQLFLLVEHRVPDARYLGPRESPHLTRMAQFMFATVPGHAFWRQVLSLSLRRCRQLLGEGVEWSDSDVLWATGPDVVTSVYHEHFGDDPAVDVAVARDFVRHECQGAWRRGADRQC